MKYHIPVLYHEKLPNLADQLETSFDIGLTDWKASAKTKSRVQLFFRADDIGVPSENFRKLIQLFQKHHLPLCLAVVPSWLTASRLRQLYDITGLDTAQWCWHQHGRLHKNFEPQGKKQEFGPARSADEIRHHLILGKNRLQDILQERFALYFTPPWNRCSMATVQALDTLGFLGISRFARAKPDISGILPEYAVNVDLHTRKESTAESAANALFTQLQTALASGFCGIMIHHQLMNEHAFFLLDMLLAEVAQRAAIQPCLFQDFTKMDSEAKTAIDRAEVEHTPLPS